MLVPSTSASHRIDTALSIMAEFASRTGLTSSAPPRRYLWTDAFAVENDLALAAHTGDRRLLDRALALVDQVHRVLGSHRGDDGRVGPLGTPEHPTRGGLRIGKKLPERRADEPFDRALEWERDGQYFHYATHWMRALAHAARAAGRPELLGWACELADAQHRAFAYGPPRARAMFWKMSIDLSRPLVRSMGQHDALDGLVTYALLERDSASAGASLAPAIADFASMIDPHALTSDDPLGIGALLVDAAELATLEGRSPVAHAPVEVGALLEAALGGIAAYVGSGALGAPVRRRLAFRELGLSIGLHAVERMVGMGTSSARARPTLDALVRYRPLTASVEAFWLAPAHRRAIAGGEHRDIDEVMLATSLLAAPASAD